MGIKYTKGHFLVQQLTKSTLYRNKEKPYHSYLSYTYPLNTHYDSPFFTLPEKSSVPLRSSVASPSLFSQRSHEFAALLTFLILPWAISFIHVIVYHLIAHPSSIAPRHKKTKTKTQLCLSAQHQLRSVKVNGMPVS